MPSANASQSGRASTIAPPLPLAPDGWGVAELGAIGAFGLAGVAPAEAFSLSLVGRVVPLLALAPGGVLLLLKGRV